MRRVSKAGLVALWLSCGASTLFGQVPHAFTNVAGKQEGLGGAAVNNPWFGAQVAYTFGGTLDPSDNLLVAATLIYDPLAAKGTDDQGDSKGFRLPVVANFSPLFDAASPDDPFDKELKDKILQLLTSAQGISVGVYPYYVITKRATLRATLHGAVAGRLNLLKDPAGDAVYLEQLRLSVGAELVIGRINEGRVPITISITPVLTLFSGDKHERVFGAQRSSLTSFEITTVAPLGGSGLGALIEGIIGEGDAKGLRAGFLYSKMFN